jgi:hypothetical protein
VPRVVAVLRRWISSLRRQRNLRAHAAVSSVVSSSSMRTWQGRAERARAVAILDG